MTPSDVTRRLAGDARLLTSAGYALLLQVAHPTVGAGVAEHSDFAQDPWGRLLRTLDYVNVTVFADAATAAEMGRRTRERHKAIKGVRPDGTRYHSLEPEAFAWVHATLAVSILDAQGRFGRPPRHWEREVFYADWRELGALVGVRERDLPEDYAGFRAYVDHMMRTRLEDNPTVHEVLRALSRPSPPHALLAGAPWRVLRVPPARAVHLATVGLLPPFLRARFGLQWTRADELQLRAMAAASRASTPVLPRVVREFGPAYLRWRALAA